MKRLIVSLYMGMGIICAGQNINAQESKEQISKEFTVNKGEAVCNLFIYNISGFIKVEGFAGDKVIFGIDKTISADDNKTLETGKKEFRLGFDQRTDTIVAYIAGPFDSRPNMSRHNNDDHIEIEYHYNVDYTVKVPYGTNLNVSTVNNGLISVNNVSGTLHINNVNDEISIKNARGTTWAHTVNGDVTVYYLTNPPEGCSYYTINGNIHVTYKPDLSADLEFRSMHGEFYTDFPDAVLLPATVTKALEKNNGGLVYKLNSSMVVRFGKGGKTFRLETLNGNVYIKKQS